MHNSYYPDEEENAEEATPLAHIPPVKVRIKKGDLNEQDALEKCIEAEYKKSIIIHNTSSAKKGWKTYIGLASAFLSALATSITILFVKFLTRDYNHHPLTVLMWRLIGGIPLVSIILGYFVCKERGKLFEEVWPMKSKQEWATHTFLALNGLLQCAGVALRFYSIEYLTLADSSIISLSGPIVVVILAHFFLKEKCGIVSVVLSLVALLGVGVIARPSWITGKVEFDNLSLIGVALGTGSMLGISLCNILIRKIRRVHFSLILFLHGLYGCISIVILALCLDLMHLPKGKTDSLYAIGMIFSTLGIQLFLTIALKYEEAARVVLVLSLEIVLSFIWQFWFFRIIPDIYSILGSVIIISTVLITFIRKWMEGLPEDNQVRKWCCCLLK